MTLIWQLMVGLSAILLISGLEGSSIGCTMQWIANGAPGKTPPCGTTTPTPQQNTNISGLTSITGGQA